MDSLGSSAVWKSLSDYECSWNHALSYSSALFDVITMMPVAHCSVTENFNSHNEINLPLPFSFVCSIKIYNFPIKEIYIPVI